VKLIETREIPLTDIIPCPLLVDREDLGKIDEITDDIFTPIIVRPSKTQEGKYERITGYRRIKKAEKDKKSTIWCAVFEMTNEEAVMTHAKENLQRKNLEEACKLVEVGFEYVTDIDGCKLFRKRK
jgi:ParB-like chromosome segregation protein Spo0J